MLTEDEAQLLALYRRMNTLQQQQLLALMRALLQS